MEWTKAFTDHVFKGKSEAELAKLHTDALALAKGVEEASAKGDHRFDGDLPSYQNIAENAGIAASKKRRQQ